MKSIDWTTQLDRRTRLYAELRERAERIVDGAGGAGAIGPNRVALAPHAAQVELELECLNQAIREQGPIDRRRNKARAIVEDRNRLLRTYRELLDVIGLERAEPPGETLNEVLAKYRPAPRGRPDSDPWGPPGLGARGRSVPRRNRDDSGNPSEGSDGVRSDEKDPPPSEVGASTSRTSCSSSAASGAGRSDDELARGSSSGSASSSSGGEEAHAGDPGDDEEPTP